MGVHQSTYDQYQGRALPGQLAGPAGPRFIKRGIVKAVTGKSLRPGCSVHYNQANDAWEINDSSDELLYGGIVVLRPGTVTTTSTADPSVPAGSNSPEYVEYGDGDVIDVLLTGFVYVRLGGVADLGDLLQFADSTRKWTKLEVELQASPSAAQIAAYLNKIRRNPVRLVDYATADNDIAIASIGFGGGF